MTYLKTADTIAMTTFRKISIGTLILLALFTPLYMVQTEPTLDFRGDRTVNNFSRYSDITILTDRVLYSPGENIPVRFRITNTGYQVLRIYPSSQINRSFQFLVLDMKGREMEAGNPSAPGKMRNARVPEVVNQQGEPIKEIILHPDETYEKVIYLDDLYALEPGREYDVSGYFFPDVRHEYFVRTSNHIKIRLSRDKKRDYLSEADGMMTNPQNPSLTPEETVYLFLSAEIKKNWPNFLKYLYLNKYITSYDRYATRYAEASDMERTQILKEFGDYLTGGRSEQLKRFKVMEVKYDRSANGGVLFDGRSYVTVHAERDTRGFVERFEYVYSLEKTADRDGFWKIIHVTARLLD